MDKKERLIPMPIAIGIILMLSISILCGMLFIYRLDYPPSNSVNEDSTIVTDPTWIPWETVPWNSRLPEAPDSYFVKIQDPSTLHFRFIPKIFINDASSNVEPTLGMAVAQSKEGRIKLKWLYSFQGDDFQHYDCIRISNLAGEGWELRPSGLGCITGNVSFETSFKSDVHYDSDFDFMIAELDVELRFISKSERNDFIEFLLSVNDTVRHPTGTVHFARYGIGEEVISIDQETILSWIAALALKQELESRESMLLPQS
jgi:hypothetical protein